MHSSPVMRPYNMLKLVKKPPSAGHFVDEKARTNCGKPPHLSVSPPPHIGHGLSAQGLPAPAKMNSGYMLRKEYSLTQPTA